MDWNSEEGKKLDARLRKEQVIWLTTVRPSGTPTPTPVWFLWDGETILIYTKPDSPKLGNLAKNARASLNLNCNEWGGDVAVLTGEIEVETPGISALHNTAYLEKYRTGIKDIQMTPESFSASYSVVLRFHIKHVRAW